MSVRVRFAPSPTGALHIGGARTALFNWLYARNQGGKFILRIEDTDRERSTLEANRAIFDGLEWLGLDWDEGPNVDGPFGPYYQTERLNIYNEYLVKLLEEGLAYFCFCTPEELERKRKESAARKEAPMYDGTCRKRTPQEIHDLILSKKPKVIRFMMPPVGETVVHDLIRGKVVFKNELLDDFVIQKSDGFPTYNFACVVDDRLMEISHVIRGDDHLSNTPRQLLLYNAFKWKPPKFAHIPMIMGKDKARLSKRHGATSVIDYEAKGYLPEAMLNYIAKLGWGYKDQEIFSREELISKFTLKGISKSSAVFDTDKLNWLNGKYIRQILPERLVDLCEPLLLKKYGRQDLGYLKKVVMALADRISLIPEVVDLSRYFFFDDLEYDEKAVEKYFKDAQNKKILETLMASLDQVDPYTKDKIEPVFKGLAKEMGLKLGAIIHPCRLALTGTLQSPPMYDVVEILGKAKVSQRLQKALSFFG